MTVAMAAVTNMDMDMMNMRVILSANFITKPKNTPDKAKVSTDIHVHTLNPSNNDKNRFWRLSSEMERVRNQSLILNHSWWDSAGQNQCYSLRHLKEFERIIKYIHIGSNQACGWNGSKWHGNNSIFFNRNMFSMPNWRLIDRTRKWNSMTHSALLTTEGVVLWSSESAWVRPWSDKLCWVVCSGLPLKLLIPKRLSLSCQNKTTPFLQIGQTGSVTLINKQQNWTIQR